MYYRLPEGLSLKPRDLTDRVCKIFNTYKIPEIEYSWQEVKWHWDTSKFLVKGKTYGETTHALKIADPFHAGLVWPYQYHCLYTVRSWTRLRTQFSEAQAQLHSLDLLSDDDQNIYQARLKGFGLLVTEATNLAITELFDSLDVRPERLG